MLCLQCKQDEIYYQIYEHIILTSWEHQIFLRQALIIIYLITGIFQ